MELEQYNYNNRSTKPPSGLLNSIFNSTVNVAARTLVSVASSSKAGNNEKWKARDHFNFMVMLMTWLTLWVLRVLMDTLPCFSPFGYSDHYLIGGGSGGGGAVGSSWDLVTSSSVSASSSSALSTMISASGSNMDLVLHEEVDRPSTMALARSLSHILALINEIPATSRKYQFATSMAENIMEENSRTGHLELQQLNRTALASSFSRTSTLLYQSLNRNNTTQDHSSNNQLSLLTLLFPARAILKALPLGSMVQSYMKGVTSCLNAVMSTLGGDNGSNRNMKSGFNEELYADVYAEKLAGELLWVTNKLIAYGAADEALVQWSFASYLSSLSLSASSRVQGYIIKISAILMGELTRDYTDMSTQVKFRLLVLWLPLFCHSSNGLAYPILTSFEKAETERAMDEVIGSLPAMDQEVILTNWLQDFAVSSSDWPNLQVTYDRWCQFTRKLVD